MQVMLSLLMRPMLLLVQTLMMMLLYMLRLSMLPCHIMAMARMPILHAGRAMIRSMDDAPMKLITKHITILIINIQSSEINAAMMAR
jgi:hypothetical protein